MAQASHINPDDTGNNYNNNNNHNNGCLTEPFSQLLAAVEMHQSDNWGDRRHSASVNVTSDTNNESSSGSSIEGPTKNHHDDTLVEPTLCTSVKGKTPQKNATAAGQHSQMVGLSQMLSQVCQQRQNHPPIRALKQLAGGASSVRSPQQEVLSGNEGPLIPTLLPDQIMMGLLGMYASKHSGTSGLTAHLRQPPFVTNHNQGVGTSNRDREKADSTIANVPRLPSRSNQEQPSILHRYGPQVGVICQQANESDRDNSRFTAALLSVGKKSIHPNNVEHGLTQSPAKKEVDALSIPPGGGAAALCSVPNHSSVTTEAKSVSETAAAPPFLAKTVTLPCAARGMPPDHNFRSAHFVIPPSGRHGQDLVCSYPTCRPVKFRYCAVCQLPVARRNFHNRHCHGLDVMPIGPALKGAPSPASAAPDSKQPRESNHLQLPHPPVPPNTTSALLSPTTAGSVTTAPRWDDKGGRKRNKSSSHTKYAAKAPKTSADNDGSNENNPTKRRRRARVDDDYVKVEEYPFRPTDGISLARQLRWCIILGERPDDTDDAEAMSAWMSQVLAVSDLAKPLASTTRDIKTKKNIAGKSGSSRKHKRHLQRRRRNLDSQQQKQQHRHERVESSVGERPRVVREESGVSDSTSQAAVSSLNSWSSLSTTTD